MPADTEFTEFAAARSGPMFRTAWLLTGDWHLAEDLIVAWIEQQVDAMVTAATADDATTR